MFKNFALLILLSSFSILYCLQEEKYTFESKNECENIEWQKAKLIHCANKIFNKNPIEKIYKLSNRRVAITFDDYHNGDIKIFNIDSGKHLKTLTNSMRVVNLCEILKNRLVSVHRVQQKFYVDSDRKHVYIKIWDTQSFKLLEEIELPKNDWPVGSIDIIYSNNEKLFVKYSEAFIIDLKSKSISKRNDSILAVQKFNNGSFVATGFGLPYGYKSTIYILDENFNKIESFNFRWNISKIEILNDNEFIVLNSEYPTLYNPIVFLFFLQNKKIISMKRLNPSIFIDEYINNQDINNIILDYLGRDFTAKIEDNIRLYNFVALSNNKLINHCSCKEHIRLCKITPCQTLQLIKELKIVDIIEKTFKKSDLSRQESVIYDFVVFEDNTIVLQGLNKVFIFKPKLQNQIT